jgi:hypothetical protein
VGSVTLSSTVANPTTHLVDNNVRRSARLNKRDGFCAVRLEGEPAKKRMINIFRSMNPLGRQVLSPLEVLQGWGINCGVDPSDISIEALMKELPCNQIVDNADAEDIPV